MIWAWSSCCCKLQIRYRACLLLCLCSLVFACLHWRNVFPVSAGGCRKHSRWTVQHPCYTRHCSHHQMPKGMISCLCTFMNHQNFDRLHVSHKLCTWWPAVTSQSMLNLLVCARSGSVLTAICLLRQSAIAAIGEKTAMAGCNMAAAAGAPDSCACHR